MATWAVAQSSANSRTPGGTGTPDGAEWLASLIIVVVFELFIGITFGLLIGAGWL